MRLTAPTKAPKLPLTDIEGKSVFIGTNGRRTLLCFFRDPACPFCNFHIYELTQKHANITALGMDVIAVFSATAEDVRRFVSRQSRPFPVIADPSGATYETYGIERSTWRKYKGILTRIPTLLKGLRIVGLAGLRTSNLLPADFLIDEHGRIAEAYYGGDAGDRIPLERVELFLARGLLDRAAA